MEMEEQNSFQVPKIDLLVDVISSSVRSLFFIWKPLPVFLIPSQFDLRPRPLLSDVTWWCAFDEFSNMIGASRSVKMSRFAWQRASLPASQASQARPILLRSLQSQPIRNRVCRATTTTDPHKINPPDQARHRTPWRTRSNALG